MRALRWAGVAVLVWGLFTGIAYMLVPLLTDGWGNSWTPWLGVGLIAICGAALLRLDPRRS